MSCGRYEIKDISPPAGITAAMALQAEAESEGARQAAINIAEGNKQQVVLAAEAEAEAILRRSEATATGLRSVAAALEGAGGAAGIGFGRNVDHARLSGVIVMGKLAHRSSTGIVSPSKYSARSGSATR